MEKRLMNKGTIFGLQFVLSSPASFCRFLVSQSKKKRPYTVLPVTMNEIYLSRRQKEIDKLLHHFDYLTPDGMPLVWLLGCKMQKPVHRLYGPDLLLELCSQSQKIKMSHFFYGSDPTLLKKLIKNLKSQFPNLKVAGFYAPPYDKELSPKKEILLYNQLLKLKPTIIWVGLGSDKQILWIEKWHKKLKRTSFIGVGAAFDFISGQKRQAPDWIQNSGLEWLFRLVSEPKRLWKRYLLHGPEIMYLIIKEIVTCKHT